MKIQQITSQNRRDFYADMICEHCGHIEKNVSGYDDTYFHNRVIPTMKCKQCGKSADQSSYIPRVPKYPDHIQL